MRSCKNENYKSDEGHNPDDVNCYCAGSDGCGAKGIYEVGTILSALVCFAFFGFSSVMFFIYWRRKNKKAKRKAKDTIAAMETIISTPQKPIPSLA